MQSVSETYERLLQDPNHYFTWSADIGSHNYGEGILTSLRISNGLIGGELGIGNAIGAEIDLEMLKPTDTIQRMARIVPYVALRTDSEVAPDTLTMGVYYIDTRSVTKNSAGQEVMSFHGYDTMLKAEAEMPTMTPTESGTYLDQDIITAIRYALGVSKTDDMFTYMNKGYMLPLPTGYTMREVLGFIAGLYGGNIVFDYAGRLKFVPLKSGARTTTAVGQNAIKLNVSEEFDPISKVEVYTRSGDTEPLFASGDDTGLTLRVVNPWVSSQQMADDILEAVEGFVYKPFTAEGALLDPAAELGDGVTVNGLTSTIFKSDTAFARLMPSDISAPAEDEIIHEYGGYITPEVRKYAREFAEVRAELRIAADAIKAEVVKKTGENVTGTFGWELTDDSWRIYNENGDLLIVSEDGFFFEGDGTFSGNVYAGNIVANQYAGYISSGMTYFSDAIDWAYNVGTSYGGGNPVNASSFRYQGSQYTPQEMSFKDYYGNTKTIKYIGQV